MSEALKPCPLCGCSDLSSFKVSDLRMTDIQCKECGLSVCYARYWQDLPRRDETAAEIAREMRAEVGNWAKDGDFARVLKRWASRLESIAQPVPVPAKVWVALEHRPVDGDHDILVFSKMSKAKSTGWFVYEVPVHGSPQEKGECEGCKDFEKASSVYDELSSGYLARAEKAEQQRGYLTDLLNRCNEDKVKIMSRAEKAERERDKASSAQCAYLGCTNPPDYCLAHYQRLADEMAESAKDCEECERYEQPQPSEHHEKEHGK